MNDIFRSTVRSFLHKERPQSKDEATTLVDDWFSRYGFDPQMLAEEIDRHFDGRAAR